MPNIAAVAAKSAELDIIAMPVPAMLEHKDQLVPAAVERAHPGIVLDPYGEIFQLVICLATGGRQLRDVAPIDADVVQRTIDAGTGEVAKSPAKKADEFGSVHLALGHRERAMADRAEATGMAVDRH